ncbi:MAG: hypothetical protein OEY56_00160 [Cyclobacteriaceae bacterium]|nr:hypothetical protein [Cyclobacteriaceae bacterium]
MIHYIAIAHPFSHPMENIPNYVNITFLAVVVTTLGFLLYALVIASPENKNYTPIIVFTFAIAWLFGLSTLTRYHYFDEIQDYPIRFLWVIGIPGLAILLALVVKKSRDFILRMPITTLTYLHIIRVPIEIILWWLTLYEVFPQILTFEGINFDILAGISAPFAGVFLVGLRSKSRAGAVIWNVLALGLALNLGIHALMASPFFFDPARYPVANVAVFSFPFVLLPGFVVPVILFSHIASLIQLFRPLPEEEDY